MTGEDQGFFEGQPMGFQVGIGFDQLVGGNARACPNCPELDFGVLKREEQLVVGGKVFCLGCGEAIPAERLAAMPGAARCVDCQREIEE